jgi:small-conductance mechanosensitive channel
MDADAFGLVAQTPNPPVNELGLFVLCGVVALIAGEKLKNIFWPARARGEEYVKQAEFAEMRATLSNYVTRLELQRPEQQIVSLSADYKELSRSMQERYETMNRNLQDVRLSVEAVRREIHEEFSKLADKLLDRIADKIFEQQPAPAPTPARGRKEPS